MKIRMGISSCLLGHKVRYDGGHKQDRFLIDTLGNYMDYVPVCPEVECGLTIPREAMRLVGDPSAPRLITHNTKIDLTEQMNSWAEKRVQELEKEELCGFIFKSKSPSSGMERVKVYNSSGMAEKTGIGLFARRFMEHFPLVPVEEEGRLHDPLLRENFIERIFALRRWKENLQNGKTAGNLVLFHTENKLLLLSHSETHYRRMGKIVAGAENVSVAEAYRLYEELLLECLKKKTTPKKHVNVLLHMMGYFKKDLSADEKQELLENINSFQSGLVPLLIPLTLLKHYIRKYNQPYLQRQTYLNPHPAELKLRNHV
jgi:uncharacterized protein YbgA (DUF1722 family)/uncharacterized protein YbbK (DUF523 family)